MADLEHWDRKNLAELTHQALAKLEQLEAELQSLREQVDSCHADRRLLLERWRETTRSNEQLVLQVALLERKAGIR